MTTPEKAEVIDRLLTDNNVRITSRPRSEVDRRPIEIGGQYYRLYRFDVRVEIKSADSRSDAQNAIADFTIYRTRPTAPPPWAIVTSAIEEYLMLSRQGTVQTAIANNVIGSVSQWRMCERAYCGIYAALGQDEFLKLCELVASKNE